MARLAALSSGPVSIRDVSIYHTDTEASLRLYYSDASPDFSARFIGYLPDEVAEELGDRLEETDVRSSLAILVRLEAAFRKDFLIRCQKRKKDGLSRIFRDLHKQKQMRIGLEDDILESWRRVHPEFRDIVGHLRGAFRFRHWLAHGSYWVPKLGRKYDYPSIYAIADAAFSVFPLYRLEQ